MDWSLVKALLLWAWLLLIGVAFVHWIHGTFTKAAEWIFVAIFAPIRLFLNARRFGIWSLDHPDIIADRILYSEGTA